MRLALKAIPLAALGSAAAMLVSCGNGNGLLASGDASSLQNALSSVQSACAAGRPDDAALAAQSFSDRVSALSPGAVDRRLIANLQQGASTLQQLVSQTCRQAAQTTTTPTTGTTGTSTATTPTATSTTTTSTTPTVPSTPTAPTPPANGNGNGGGGTGGDGNGGGQGNGNGGGNGQGNGGGADNGGAGGGGDNGGASPGGGQ
jgi:hypothetical protein